MTNVPYTFGNETSPIPLSQLDANFAVVPNYANTAGNVVNAAQANITSVGVLTSLSVSGNITNSQNIFSSGLASVTGNVTGANLFTGGAVSAFGNILGASFSATGSITGASSMSLVGGATVGSVASGSTISAVGNITGGNITTAGKLSVGGNITTTGNIQAQGIVSAVGNIVTDEFFVGNFLGNVTGNLSVGGSNTQVLFNLNGNVGAAGGLTYNKDSNVLTVLGQVSAQANVTTGGNIIVGTNAVIGGNISATGNLVAQGGQFTGLVTAPTPITASANNQVATTAFVNNKVGTLGTMASQNANSVAITGGTLSGISLSGSTISGTSFSLGNIANANIGNSSISGLTSALAVTDGGTGATSLPANNVLLGNGTSAPQGVAPGTSGNLLTSNGSTWISQGVAAIPAFGPGQTWQNYTGSRATDTTYTNSTGRPIFVIAQVGAQTNGVYVYIDGVLVIRHWYDVNGGAGQVGYSTAEFMVAPGSTYYVTAGPLRQWWEYR